MFLSTCFCGGKVLLTPDMENMIFSDIGIECGECENFRGGKGRSKGGNNGIRQKEYLKNQALSSASIFFTFHQPDSMVASLRW